MVCRPCRLGEGWLAEEALAIAVYCALVAEDFAHGVKLAVNHSGDSDSTRAMTGNILDALVGAAGIPQGWLERLELRDEPRGSRAAGARSAASARSGALRGHAPS